MSSILYPQLDCPLCPRLAAFRDENKQKFPAFHNAPVMPFGDKDASVLIVGLAPGLKGANATGRPFTGDFAGDLLYSSLQQYGFAAGQYKADPQDGLQLIEARITNAVKCVPPQNKPVGAEISTCRRFLESELSGMPQLRAILCLGKISHDSVLRTLGLRLAAHPFTHGARHDVFYKIDDQKEKALSVFDSYHCSRYNTNTGRLTEAMFYKVIAALRQFIDEGKGS